MPTKRVATILLTLGVMAVLSETNATAAKAASRDGQFWLSMSAEAKHGWIEGYIAASAMSLVWASSESIGQPATQALMASLEIFEIIAQESDAWRIVAGLDAVYSKPKYRAIELVSALRVLKHKITRSDDFWRFDRELSSLPEDVQEAFRRHSNGAIRAGMTVAEMLQMLEKFVRDSH